MPRRLITGSKADKVLGSTTTPHSLAMLHVVSENQALTVCLPASSKVAGAERRHGFQTHPREAGRLAGSTRARVDNSGRKSGLLRREDQPGFGEFGHRLGDRRSAERAPHGDEVVAGF